MSSGGNCALVALYNILQPNYNYAELFRSFGPVIQNGQFMKQLMGLIDETKTEYIYTFDVIDHISIIKPGTISARYDQVQLKWKDMLITYITEMRGYDEF